MAAQQWRTLIVSGWWRDGPIPDVRAVAASRPVLVGEVRLSLAAVELPPDSQRQQQDPQSHQDVVWPTEGEIKNRTPKQHELEAVENKQLRGEQDPQSHQDVVWLLNREIKTRMPKNLQEALEKKWQSPGAIKREVELASQSWMDCLASELSTKSA